jgi:hypothetical protein
MKTRAFSGSKLARADRLITHVHLETSLKISGAIPPLNLSAAMAYFTLTPYLCTYLSTGHILSGLIKEPFIHHLPLTCTLHDTFISSPLIQLH